jgi:hypothetical protein
VASPADPDAAFFAAGSNLWLATGARTGLQRIDLGNPAVPRVAERTPPLSSANILTGDVEGNLGVVGDQQGRLLTVDLTDPAEATVLGTLDMGTQVRRVAIDRGRVWVVWLEGRESRLSLVDISVPSLPDEIAVATLAGEPDALLARGAGVFLLREGGLEVWQADVPATRTPAAPSTPRPSATPVSVTPTSLPSPTTVATPTPIRTAEPSATPSPTSGPRTSLWLPRVVRE